jgi:hypothetical protein
MGVDLLVRALYVRADTGFDLTAAVATAHRLTAHAGPDDLRALLDTGVIDPDLLHPRQPDPVVPDTGPVPRALDVRDLGDWDLLPHIPALRAAAATAIAEDLVEMARSLDGRDVDSGRLDNDESPGVLEYTTGGLSSGDAPTDAYHAWDVLYEDGALPPGWAAEIATAAGLLHPYGTGPAVATVTYHQWRPLPADVPPPAL